jgi:flagellar biosynthesis protein FlhG
MNTSWRIDSAGRRPMPKDDTGPQAAPVKVIAVTGGKGGVGKTTVTANLAVALAEIGREVMVLDADLGLANLDVLLGLQPRFNLSHVLSGERTLEEILVEGPKGIQIVPASSGVRKMASLGAMEHAGLIRAFSDLKRRVDVLLVDTAAGIHDEVLTFARAAHHALVVVCDEPASITDAYALIKVLSREQNVGRFRVVANQTRGLGEGRELFDKLARVCERFLDVTLEYAGAIPHDEFVRRAIQRQAAVVEAFPGSIGAQAFKKLAAKADTWAVPAGARGHLEFFLERLVMAGVGVGALQ